MVAIKKLLIDYQDIAREWNYQKNNIDINTISYGSTRNIWWKCLKGHEWKAHPYSRIVKNSNCPYCSNRRVNSENSLKELFPLISKEWHPIKNGKLKPDNIVAGSNKRVWWQCKNGHEWKTNPAARTKKKGTGCPRCSKRISSFELRLLSELGGILKNVTPTYKYKGVEIDLYLKDQKIGIEYDGWYYHKQRYKQDKAKNNFLKKNKIYLIRFREKPLNKISFQDILIKQNKLTKNDLNQVLKKIIKISNLKNDNFLQYLSKKSFQFQKEYQKYLSFYPSPIPQNSLKQSHPKLIEDWDYKKNYPLKPENFYTNSSTPVWWKCKKGHSWKRRIANRTLKKLATGCPFCAGKRVSNTNSLISLFPKIAKEFNYEKNKNFSPENLISGSHLKIWWICKKGHEWKAEVRSRTRLKTNCPYCSGSLATKENNLAVLFPKLVKNEWCFKRNKKILPSNVTPQSNKKYWWKCKFGHTWKAGVHNRTERKSGCVYCANLKVSNTNNLKVVSPKIASEWHPTKNYPIKPSQIIAKTGKRYWWKCKHGHEWQNSPANRFTRGCPYCGKHFVTIEKSLKYKYPELAKEWHPKKNIGIAPDKIHANSNKKVWWRCKYGHEFLAVIANRHQRNKISKCLQCKSNSKI